MSSLGNLCGDSFASSFTQHFNFILLFINHDSPYGTVSDLLG